VLSGDVGAYWQQVVQSGATVPSERALSELTAELVEMLGAADPHLREDLGTAVLSRWISLGVYDDLLASLGDTVSRGLRVGLGARDDDTVFRRSSSARILGPCIERDNQAHLLPVDAILRWADRSLSWFARERDDRGWVDGAGSAHSISHGADLLAACAASRHLDHTHLAVILDVIGERLAATTTYLHDGEDERLARAVLAVVHRELVEIETLETWLETIAELADTTRTPPTHAGRSPAAHNATQLLRTLFVELSLSGTNRAANDDGASPPRTRADLLLTLARVLPRNRRSPAPPPAEPRSATGV
jgi:hypothetical protein